MVDFIVSSQEEERDFNVNSSMKTDVHCVAGVRELHIYTVNKLVPSSNALDTIEMRKGVVHFSFWQQRAPARDPAVFSQLGQVIPLRHVIRVQGHQTGSIISLTQTWQTLFFHLK